MNFLRKHLFSVPVFNFLIAAVFGLLLRTMLVYSLPFNFKYFTHAHSHVAILGWVYMTLFILLVQYFVGEFNKNFQKVFWFTEIAVIGMILSFPVQGYAAFSIVSSSLYIVLSYFFTVLLLKKTKGKQSAAFSLLRSSLFWLCLSTISLWSLGPIMVKLGAGSKPALLAIQFFLHFQLNGWFLFALLALLFHFLKIPASKTFNRFHWFFIGSLIFKFALPINWYYDFAIFRLINGVGILFQLIALFYGFRILQSNYSSFFGQLDKLSKRLLVFAALSFVFKILFQSFSIFPDIAKHIFDNHQAVIGFIHLMMLGIVSAFLFFVIRLQIKNPKTLKWASVGIYSFVTGIVATELILLYQGLCFYYPSLSIPNYPVGLWLFSFALVIGILMNLIATIRLPFKDKPEYPEP